MVLKCLYVLSYKVNTNCIKFIPVHLYHYVWGTPAKFRYGCCCYSFYFYDLYGFPTGSFLFSLFLRGFFSF